MFHAYMLPTPVTEVPYVMVTADELQKENEEYIREEAQHLHGQFGLEVEWVVRIGIASDEIKELIREKGIDLIVMGMKGAGGLDKIIGSTTTNVNRKVAVPVLVVPHDATYRPIHQAAYATDLTEVAQVAIFEPFLELVKNSSAKVHILHVAKSDAAGAGELVSRKGQENLFEGLDHEFVTVTDSSITQGINNYLKNNQIDLLTMVAHKHSFFERLFSKSYTAAMSYETHIPLLVLHEKGNG